MGSPGAKQARRMYGVDFSGAVRAGHKIWLTGGVLADGGLRIESCRRGAELPGSGPERDRCLAALRDFIGRDPLGVFGLDFPFGLPLELARAATWEGLVGSFARRYPAPDAFRQACRDAAGGRELKRLTDRESRTPFSPYNIRLYRQTYFGIAGLLAPLVDEGAVSVLPMQPPRPGRAWLVEICPASTLKRLGLNEPYKGRGEGRRAARSRILEALARLAPLTLPAGLRSVIVDDAEGDALDSLLATLAVFRGLNDLEAGAGSSSASYHVEGYVYV
jgi:hypothetical protein